MLPQVNRRFLIPLVLAWCAFLSLALRLTFLNEPIERDEGFYSAIGLQLLDGAILYRDIAEQKGPLLFYLYAFGLATFGKSAEALRIFTAFYNLVTLCGVYWIAREVAGQRAGLVAALIYAVFSSVPMMQAAGSNAEVFLALPLVLTACYLLSWMRTGRQFLLIFAGLACVSALLIKLVAAPLALLAWIVVTITARNCRTHLSSQAYFLLPQIVVVAIMLALLAQVGALSYFIQFTLVGAIKYVANTNSVNLYGPALSMVLQVLWAELMPISVLGLGLLLVIPLIGKDNRLLYVCLLPWAALGAVLIPGKNFPHYFINLVPFLSATTAIAILSCFNAKHTAIRWISLIPALFLVFLIAKEHEFYWKMTSDEVSIAKYGSDEFVRAKNIALWIKERTSPEDYIFHWGFNPQVYLISGRRFLPRFISSMDVSGYGNTPALRQELAGYLKTFRPAYIVIFPKWSRYPGASVVHDFIRSNSYFLEYADDVVQAYRRPN